MVVKTGVDGRIGKYRIVRELGHGGMGVVYLSQDEDLGRPVAIKVLHSSMSLDPDFRGRFRQEARTIASLVHPHIVRIHSFLEIDDVMVIESEFVEGGSLADVMTQRGVTPHQVARFGVEMLEALICCHDLGIVHRDVKPTNILLDRYGRALLADFGLAKIYFDHLAQANKSSSTSRLFLGTPRYAAPEAWDGTEPSPLWDLYSLGMVMYEAISGHCPYDASSPFALLKQIMERKPDPLREVAPHVSVELGDLVDSMVSRDPANRPQTARAALETLRNTQEYGSAPTSSSPTIVQPRPLRPSTIVTAAHRVSAAWKRNATVISVLLFAALCLAVSIQLRLKPGMDMGADKLPPPDYQIDLVRTGIPEEESINAFALGPASQWLVLDSLDHETLAARSGNWLFKFEPGGKLTAVVMADEESLCRLEASEDTDQAVKLDGFWADYQGLAGAVYRHGTASGTGRWNGDRTSFTARLEFTNEQDNSRWEEVLTGTVSPTWTDTAFLLRMEEQPNTHALIYNELVPRGKEWAEHLEQLLPAMSGMRTQVAISAANRPDFHPNGMLDEVYWNMESRARDGGVLAGYPMNGASHLILRFGNDGVYIAAYCRTGEGVKSEFECQLTARYRVFMDRQPRVTLFHNSDGESLVELMPEGGPVGDSESWALGDAYHDGVWTVEGFVAYSILGLTGPPESGHRIRTNAVIRAGKASDIKVPVALWGYPAVDRIEHGAIIVVQ
ncbi:MAG: hypothetical protein AMXMBFR84_17060 [Candidatus Hydrogenedentota bacterium]